MTAASSFDLDCDIEPASEVGATVGPHNEATSPAQVDIGGKRRLSTRQKQVLEWVAEFARTRGYPPTLREIGTAFGIRSTNGVNDHLRALERKGYLVREQMKSRGIFIVGDVGRGNDDPAANAISFLKDENRSLRELLSRLAEACNQAPSITARMAVILGDVRSVLRDAGMR